jgi:hypothetical protein
MIKLIDLLKEIHVDELELRSGELSQRDIDIYYSFLENFNYSIDDYYNEENSQIQDGPFTPTAVRGKVLWEGDGCKLVQPMESIGELYLINPDGRTLFDYVIGFVRLTSVNKEVINSLKVPGVKIFMIRIASSWKGKGYGLKLYQGILETFKTIFSDEILYEGSYSIWTNKLAPLGNESGNFFGLQAGKVVIPLTVEDSKNADVLGDVGSEEFIISVNPPSQLLNLKAKLNGLSISKGDYGVFEADDSISVNTLKMVTDSQTTLSGVESELDLYQVVGVGKQYDTIMIPIDSGVAILKQENGKVNVDII